jgi:putative ABC transport system ATP-binding protein
MNETVRCTRATRRFTSRGIAPVTAVDSVDLVVQSGEFVAIEGPSGSGKTTLLGLLAGIDRPDDGTVSVLGHDLARLSPLERARLRRSKIGIVFQSFGLIAALDVGENVALPLTLAGVDPASRHERAQAGLDEVGLGHAIHARIDELSGGERQRIGVARALITNPGLVLADEPAGSLDDETGSRVIDLLERACRGRRATLVLVTHDPSSASRADRRISMSDGRLSEKVN